MPAIASARRLDHLVLPARDLEAQAAFYERMGFTVGARNIHPWGTENRIVQFNGCFLELITLGTTASPPEHAPRRFSFGAHVRDWLAGEGDGMSMLVLDSPDARADALWFNQAGIGEYEPFDFARTGKRPDGSEVEVAFSLAFAAPAMLPDLGFFVCEQHFPQNFWNPAQQVHHNRVVAVRYVVIVHDRPLESLAFFKAFAGGDPACDERGLALETGHGSISVWTPEGARSTLGDDPALFDGRRGRFAAVVFEVEKLDVTELVLRKNNVPHRRDGGRILVPSGASFGVLILFEEALS